jgi:hypothetical protein
MKTLYSFLFLIFFYPHDGTDRGKHTICGRILFLGTVRGTTPFPSVFGFCTFGDGLRHLFAALASGDAVTVKKTHCHRRFEFFLRI